MSYKKRLKEYLKRKETVNKVIDGDTLNTKSRKYSLRLANLNTPEKGEKGYKEAKNALEELVLNKKIEIKPKARDSYGRIVAEIRVNGKSVNRAMKKFQKKN